MKTLIIEESATSYSDVELIEQIELFLTGNDTEFHTANGTLATILFRSIAKEKGINPSALAIVFENGVKSTVESNWRYTKTPNCMSLNLMNDALVKILV